MTLAHDIQHVERTQDIKISLDVTFETMLLTSKTLQGLKSSGFYKPSPIQLHGIPLGKCGFDLLLEAKSGTGKTAVFTVVALEKLDLNKNLQVMVLAPTREIAAQICDVMKQIGSSYEGLNVEVVMGGLSVQDDISKFKNKVQIIVGSPGRLHHLIKDKHIDVSTVRLLILDEADKLMEKSFEKDIKYIFNILPKQKQVIMSSATYPGNTKTFINSFVQNAQHICPDSNCVLLGVDQKITVVQYNSNIVKQTQIKFQELLKVLTNIQFKQCLIFCNYQVRVTELHKLLNRKNWPAEQLYGRQEQTDRLDALKTLQEYKCRILVSTDLAARGIDSSNVDLVINFEAPFEWQIYLHRIGRAGRFGSYGMSITILSQGKEEKNFKSMLGPLSDSITLSNPWSVSKIICKNESQSQQYVPVSLHRKEQCEQLWNLLTTEITQDKPEDESFESLCNSFYNNSKVETFDDLIESFNNNHYQSDSSVYKIINVTNKLFKDIVPIKNQNITNVQNINLQSKGSPMNLMNNEYTFSKIQTNISEGSISNDDGTEETVPVHISSERKIKNKTLKSSKIANNMENKWNCRYNSSDYVYSNNRKSNVYESHQKSIPTTYINSRIEYSELNKPSCEKPVLNQTHKWNKRRLKTNQSTNISYSSNYVTWHRQLKLNMQQIENAIYIHEISKL